MAFQLKVTLDGDEVPQETTKAVLGVTFTVAVPEAVFVQIASLTLTKV